MREEKRDVIGQACECGIASPDEMRVSPYTAKGIVQKADLQYWRFA